MRQAKPHQDRPEEPLGMCCGGRGRLAWPLAKRRHASGPGYASARLSRHLVYVGMPSPWPALFFS
ncbi:hypothetical protein COCSADRAFT_212159 [Bipolaris sorokiniana ND90Pr]|uniref:Uncharacterized protein n=1 Tax=Cochliobolus sativus (strain ND90Pr / ATCC 201652) TaxID=665912 RepID=M2SQW6_COCSN|nr:uncharacterized protein COCSADRAFT_212159 [Bipolaris sorokiniana ND90Pr]EMD69633.1 hypothetical protein COCSADRAFT_212159 [Bipolaris sorokiniana ND90Pr]